MAILTIQTKPYEDQKPGTSGLRKKTKVFMQPNYVANFAQATFNTFPDMQGSIVVLGGDGRFYNDRAIQVIIKIAAANGVGRIIVGRDGVLSTPAASLLIRKNEAAGGIILSASHNPAGPDEDFGIKVNASNGGPAMPADTDRLFEACKTIDSYLISDAPDVDISRLHEAVIENMAVQVVDSVEDYAIAMQDLFDFDGIKSYIKSSGLRMKFDAMNAVTGPYARKIFVDLLELPEDCLMNAVPKDDFGGLHPEPMPSVNTVLVEMAKGPAGLDFAAACDGDGDRNMILGRDIFVSPCDSLAVLAANYFTVPAYKDGLNGVARTIATSAAADTVAKDLRIPCYETPVGWKFFGNLLDAGMVTLCGEESFGTGADYIREKDGLFAVLFWLNIIAARQMPVKDIVTQHWMKYGRNYYCRHDYVGLPKEVGDEIMALAREKVAGLAGQELSPGYVVQKADDFAYTDPVDNSVAANQGIRIIFENRARIVFRLSGTGSVGATLRVYLEEVVIDHDRLDLEVGDVVAGLAKIVQDIALINQKTGRTKPDTVV
ncbi:MAG: alpha-D-glucose phosphate-specific phosphoglucomutase [Alphaproteobacteria bacterium]|nr:alpha-D-glucose phosphate-specific phosphoglucomutase [Alphaproteobacteria bacterium]